MRASLLIVAAALLAGTAGLLAGRWWFAPERLPDPPAPPGVTVLAIGERRIDLVLPDLAGQPQSLAQFDGKPLLINFWATWCPPCVRELPLLDAWHARRDSDGLAVLAIALETDPTPVAAFLAERGLALPVWLAQPARTDVSTTFGNTRGVLPYSVLISADGRLLAQKLGEIDEADLRRWRELARR